MKALYGVRCTKNENDSVIGIYYHNHMLNRMIYDIEFLDGEIKEYRG